MEHIDAPSLQFYREGGRNPHCTLDNNDAKQVLYRMTDALNFIHSKGINHDDIKPANILYSKDRGPVLIDFGWSSNGSVHSAGSPWYIPPEYADDGERGPAGDIFALGVVMLFLLRKVPLPELQSPRLTWRIHHLRRVGPEADKANRAMSQWLEIIAAAVQELENITDKTMEKVISTVEKMVEFNVKERITGHQIYIKLANKIEPPNDILDR